MTDRSKWRVVIHHPTEGDSELVFDTQAEAETAMAALLRQRKNIEANVRVTIHPPGH